MALLPEDPQKRKVVLYGGAGVVLILTVWFFLVYEPATEEIQAQRQHHGQLSQQAQIIAAGADDEEAEETERVSRQLDVVEGLIPSGEELPVLLDQISAEATQTGVDLSLIRPAGATRQEHYTRRTYELAALGSYHAIGDFLARIGSLPRIITPTDLRLQRAAQRDRDDPEQPRLEARFSIETYVANGVAREADDE